jgi:hypothetical protein
MHLHDFNVDMNILSTITSARDWESSKGVIHGSGHETLDNVMSDMGGHIDGQHCILSSQRGKG